jgi:hypothetical protein
VREVEKLDRRAESYERGRLGESHRVADVALFEIECSTSAAGRGARRLP